MSLQLCQCGRDGRYTHVCGAMYVAGTVTAGALSFEPAPQPPADAATCAYCGRVRSNLWHKVTSDPGTHAFVELTTKPAAPPVSDDEAAMSLREQNAAADAVGDEWARIYQQRGLNIGESELARKAYRAGLERGRALGARDELLARSCVWDPFTTGRGTVLCTKCRWSKDRGPFRHVDKGTPDAIEIARRSGGQGK
jgi:hypothetical protein